MHASMNGFMKVQVFDPWHVLCIIKRDCASLQEPQFWIGKQESTLERSFSTTWVSQNSNLSISPKGKEKDNNFFLKDMNPSTYSN